jgi:hypothetical protein
LNLETDAQRAAAATLLPAPIDMSLQAAGSIRADLKKGSQGTISYADVFRVVPLGSSPFDGTTTYPLVHAYLWLAEIKDAFDLLAANQGLLDSDFFLVPSGIRVTFDTSRPAFDPNGDKLSAMNGRVTKIEWDSTHTVGADTYDTVLFDITRADPWFDGTHSAISSFHVVTTLYLATFATSAGVTLKQADGSPLALMDAVIRRPGPSELKDQEALAWYIKQISDKNGGMLPARYDATQAAGKVPRRMICTGPLCMSP